LAIHQGPLLGSIVSGRSTGPRAKVIEAHALRAKIATLLPAKGGFSAIFSAETDVLIASFWEEAKQCKPHTVSKFHKFRQP